MISEMLQSTLFPKTKKDAPKDAFSINHQLLVRAGFIDQLMAGSWTLLPLGWRVVSKINQITASFKGMQVPVGGLFTYVTSSGYLTNL